MSKKRKNKLKEQHEEQLRQKRLEEQEEQEERRQAKARGSSSMAAKKMRRAARRGYLNALMIFFTVLMLLFFLYSGVVYGGIITVYGSLSGAAELIPHSVAYAMLAGDFLIAAGIIFSFRGREIIQGLFVLPGTGVFMWGALTVINDLKERLSQPGTDPAVYGMDEQYMRYYLPILGAAFFSLIILIHGLTKHISAKRREKKARENAPVKSIVD